MSALSGVMTERCQKPSALLTKSATTSATAWAVAVDSDSFWAILSICLVALLHSLPRSDACAGDGVDGDW